MKQTIAIILILISLSGFSQAPKEDTLKLSFTFPELQFIYQAIDSQHGDHVAIKKLLTYIEDETNKQLKPKTDSTSKKKP